MSNYYTGKKGKKGTGEHALSNSDLKKLLEKQGLLETSRDVTDLTDEQFLDAMINPPCFECGSTEKIGTACKPCNPEITDPNFGMDK